MKVEKLVKDLFKNHSVLAVVLGAVALVYFLDNYSKGKGTFGRHRRLDLSKPPLDLAIRVAL